MKTFSSSTKSIVIGVTVITCVAFIVWLVWQQLYAVPSARDNDRVVIVDEMVIAIEQFRREFNRYPPRVTFDTGFSINGDFSIDLEEHLEASYETNATSTYYYYESNIQDFALCIDREIGERYEAGTIPCRQAE